MQSVGFGGPRSCDDEAWAAVCGRDLFGHLCGPGCDGSRRVAKGKAVCHPPSWRLLSARLPLGRVREPFATLLPGGCRVPGCHQAGWGTPLPPSFLEAVGCQAAEIGQGGGPQVFDEQCW